MDSKELAVRMSVIETKLENHGKELERQSQTMKTISEVVFKQAEMTQQLVNTNDRITHISTTVGKIGDEVHSLRGIAMKGLGGISVTVFLSGIIFSILRLAS